MNAGGAPAPRIARWDGAGWSPLPSTVNGVVFSLKTFDDGAGPALFAGGGFTTAGGMAAKYIARWDGAGWSALGAGFNDWVEALATFDDGTGPALCAGGNFDVAYDSGDSFLARWGGCVHLGFDVEDDLETPLANGQDLSSPAEFGRHVSISSFGPNAGAAIFDSTPGGPNDPGPDLDLLVGRGNLLVLQSDLNAAQTLAGVFDQPDDDADGGTLRFFFRGPVRLCSVDLVDLDDTDLVDTTLVQIDRNGRQRIHTVPAGWTGDLVLDGVGRSTLDLTELDPQPGFASTATATEDLGFEAAAVRTLEIRLGSSAAVDDLRWSPSDRGLFRGPRKLAKKP